MTDQGPIAQGTPAVPLAEDQPTMTVEQILRPLGISRSTAYEAVRSGEIPTIRIGRRILVPTAAVRRMLQLDDPAVVAA